MSTPFNDEVSKNLTISDSVSSIFYHTNLTFNDPKEECLEKLCGKRTKCSLRPFSIFPYNVF